MIIKILIPILVVGALAAFLFFALLQKNGTAQAFVDRDNYQVGESLEVAVTNDFDRKMCFSSCYPYLMERRREDGKWEEYEYSNCPDNNLAADCILVRAQKKFRIMLDDVVPGVHRLKINACVGCAAAENFVFEREIYSNIFEIK